MRQYSNIISLTKNERGIYSLDTTIGCESGMKISKLGCYNDCYSAKSAKLYGYDFNKTILRDFKNKKHLIQICNKIKKIKLPFIRIGSSGDPSENWEHTIKICKLIHNKIKSNQITLFNYNNIDKQIVIITKHWTNLNEYQMQQLKEMNICINTSVSAIDEINILNNRLNQYNILKNYCISVLRIVSFDFNIENELGYQYSLIQQSLFKNENIIDTVFRSSKNNDLVKNNIIKIHKTKFLGKNALISKYNKKTYFGNCNNCIELCGSNNKLFN